MMPVFVLSLNILEEVWDDVQEGTRLRRFREGHGGPVWWVEPRGVAVNRGAVLDE
jgi:hypothetical protein